MFQGFSQEAVDFLWGIRFNNERGWFEAHKEEYLTLVAGPMRELGEQVHAAVEEEFPKLGLNLHVSRIYRDARRLHGRGPYKDHLWFTLRRPKEEWVSQPAFYFELAPEYYSMGMGWYDATHLTMAKLRARIDRDPGSLLSPWYNRKSIAISRDENCGGLLFQPELAEQVIQGFRFLKPYYEYLFSLAGDPTPEGM